MDLIEEPPVRRRRGQELEDALLDAAWDELVASGYAALTIDAVAARAGTSRPVVYRRWPTKHDLVRAAVGHAGTKEEFPLPDTGTLRGDLIALLQRANKTRLGFAAVLSVRLGQYFEETGTGPADLREEMIGDRTTSVQRVIERSIARGEIDPARLTPRIADLPFDLFRHEILMTMKPVPQATLEEIIDTIFLPLVAPHKEA